MYRTVPYPTCSSSAWRTPRPARLRPPAPDDSGPVWLTWEQVGQRAKAIAAGLHGLGVGLENPVAILANTRLDWVLADFGIMCAGGATTTVYPPPSPRTRSTSSPTPARRCCSRRTRPRRRRSPERTCPR
ncbi:AMP-binding protein [Micromonospora sp. BRA006-A]|nr:AMP-binding protein [Micromonospora sp. BRA006-A]